MSLIKRLLAKLRQPASRAVLEELEPRVLYSADFSPAILDPSGSQAHPEQRIVDSAGEYLHQAQQDVANLNRHSEIVFVDARVHDAERLLADLRLQRADELEIITLHEETSGLTQISQALEGRRDVSAIHLISHGKDGEIQLGSSTLNFDTLVSNTGQIKHWGEALTEQADLLIYGCDVAATEHGEAMLRALSRLTGADVAASVDLTGSAQLGGDWDLEKQFGIIETPVALSEILNDADWRATLALTPQGTETRVNSNATGTQTTTAYGGGNVAMDSAGNYVVVWNDDRTNAGDVYFQRYDAAGVAQGANTLVNTFTTNLQNQAQVAMDASGNFVVVWSSTNQDGGSTGIYAQRYNASGVAQGGEFRVNTTTANAQDLPTVAMSSSGAFVVAWLDSTADSGTSGIYAQRYDAAGVAQGGQFRVNTTSTNSQQFASAAMDASGNFVIVWESNQTGNWNTYGQRYNAAGVAQGGEFLVNTTTTGDQWQGAVAMDSSGNFVVVWEATSQDPGGNAGIYAQRYNASGVAQGGEFRVNTTTINGQTVPAVAMNASGGFIVSWASDQQDGSAQGTYLQQYSASGVAVGGEVRAATTTTNDQNFSSVAYAGGNAVVVWSGNGTGDASGVFMQRYTNTQLTATNELRANTTTTDSQITSASGRGSHRAVAISPAGNYVAVWSSNNQDGSGWGVYAQRFDRTGTALGSEFRVSTTTSNAQQFATVAMDDSGNFVVTWNGEGSGDTDGVFFQRYNAAGVAQGGETLVNSTVAGTQTNPSIAMSSAGDFTVVWQGNGAADASGIYAQRFNAAGVAQGGEFHVNTLGTFGAQINPSIAMDDAGNFVIAFEDTGGNAIVIQRYNSAGALQGMASFGGQYTRPAVAMDSSGDFVVAWKDISPIPDAIVFQRFNAAGTTQGAITRADQSASSSKDDVSVAMDAAGNFIVTYEGNSGGDGSGIFARRFDAAGNALGSEFLVNQTTLGTQHEASIAMLDLNNYVVVWSGEGTGDTNGVFVRQFGEALNTITVDTTSDVADGDTSSLTALQANRGADGFISLREAIVAANNTANGASPDRITFNIAGAGPHIINITSILPNIAQAVIIDGTSEPDYTGSPVVVLNGGGTVQDGLRLYAGSDGSTIRGLVIQNFAEDGIDISGSSSNTVAGNFIGTNSAGTAAAGNVIGVNVFDGDNNTIGGTNVADRNIISGNTNSGINVAGGSDSNHIVGNYIGLTASGTAALGNTNLGIGVFDSVGIVIGDATVAGRNVISATNGAGVFLLNTDNATIRGNYIGTDSSGTIDLGNANHGVLIGVGSSGNTIGGTSAGARNLISGNALDGVAISGLGADGNMVLGNYIGTDQSGLLALGNSLNGVGIYNQAANNIIGGSAIGASNVIARNTNNGVSITDVGTSGNSVQGNLIGVNATNTAALGNGAQGVWIGSAVGNTIGGTAPGAGNVIGGSVFAGIELRSTGNVVQGNYIGTNTTGTLDLGNATAGILVVGASGNTIGGTAAGAGNTIAFNDNAGLVVFNTASANAILGNNIYANAGLAIDLAWDGTSANDLSDADSGPNNLQNHPQLNAVMTDGAGNVTIVGSINTAASSTYRIEFFASTSADPSGHGEGQRYIGFANVTTDASGNATVAATLSATVAAGEFISATATDAANNTSEFGNARAAVHALVVTTTADVVDGNVASVDALIANAGADGRVSLREAIQATNATAGLDTITFAIPLTDANHLYYRNDALPGSLTNVVTTQLANASIGDFDPDYPATAFGWYRIALTSELSIFDAVTIDATTQNGFVGQPVIELSGLSAGATDTAIRTYSNNLTLRGFAINDFGGHGLRVDGNNAVIQGNYFGTDVTGTIAKGNMDGVQLQGSNALLGGTTPAQRNILSGNDASGVTLVGAGNIVRGNYIGVDYTGSKDLGNSQYGVFSGGANNIIGGGGAGEGNVISGNTWAGVDLANATNNVVAGNLIGTNAAGTNAIGNGNSGVEIALNSTGNMIGGAGSARNVISGNAAAGVLVSATGANTVQANYIGVNAGGNVALPNQGGIWIVNSANQTVRANIISGNSADGVLLDQANADNNLIAGNIIGLGADGTTIVGNGQEGVQLSNGASGNTIGGANLGDRNVIAGNTTAGINIFGTSNGNTILGNYIGVDITGTLDRGNGGSGVTINNSSNNTVGGTSAGARNIISGNASSGVSILLATATNNVLQGNYIGTDISGTLDVGNDGDGVLLFQSGGNTVGGTAIGAGNVISGNAQRGIRIEGVTAVNNIVQGNLIGTNAAGTSAIANSMIGVSIQGGASNNQIGGSTAAARNVISGNASHGIEIASSSSTNNKIQGNYIGVGANGSTLLGNLGRGVSIVAADGNIVGGSNAGEGNVISDNGNLGIYAGANNTTIQGNYVGTDATGSLLMGNQIDNINIAGSNNLVGGLTAGAGNIIAGSVVGRGVSVTSGSGNRLLGNRIYGNAALGIDLNTNGLTLNDSGDLDGGANNSQNFPVLTAATTNGTQLHVAGSLNSVASTSFRIEFFASAVGDTSGYGEGQRYLGFVNVTTDASGDATITTTLTASVAAGEIISATATNLTTNDTSEFALNVAATNTLSIAGTIYEDVAGGGTLLGAVGRGSVTVNLYQDDGDGVIDAGDALITSATTNASGAYNFSGLLGGTYWVAVDSTTLSPSTGLRAGYTLSDVWAEQTYGSLGAAAYNGTYSYLGASGAFYGGMRAQVSDNAAALLTSEHVTRVILAGASASAIDSAFSFSVISNARDGDDAGGVNRSVQGSSRQFIQNSNAITGVQKSQFRIANTDPNYNLTGNGEYRITPTSALATIVDALVLDGTTQSGYAGTPIIELKGSSAGAGVHGLHLAAGSNGSTVRGLVVNEFGGDGIRLSASNNNLLEANRVGTNVSGTADAGNIGHGINLFDSAANTIRNNLVSGNDLDGVLIYGAGSSANVVTGNRIGTDAAGTAAIGNTRDGVVVSNGASANTIGGTTAAERNILSGNLDDGIELFTTGTNNNVVSGNYIGVDVTGLNALGNQRYGVVLYDGVANTMIGGTAPGAGNVISGNAQRGIQIDGNNNAAMLNNAVQGNLIGLNKDGNAIVANGGDGIIVFAGANGTLIGGAAAGARNVISGNATDGIFVALTSSGVQVINNYIGTDITGTLDLGNADDGIELEGASNLVRANLISGNNARGVQIRGNNNTLEGNLIGTNAAGTAAIANSQGGILVHGNASGNMIGGTTAAQRNVISGNSNFGVSISGSATSGTTLQGNYIGVDATGNAALGNAAGVYVIDSTNNVIGGAAAGAGNVISGNAGDGLLIDQAGATANIVRGNLIGTNAAGTAAIGNGQEGVQISNNASGNIIGGSAAGEGNVISGNQLFGVSLFLGANNNAIQGNRIGTNRNGNAALANIGGGVLLQDAANNTIGGSAPGQGNLISGNAGAGVFASGTSSGNVLQGNLIGTDATGASALANVSGVFLNNGANNNAIGGTSAGARNVISGNTQDGIYIQGAATQNNLIQGNYIGVNATSTAVLGNGDRGIQIENGARFNIIGGTTAGAGNTIGGNANDGILISDSSASGTQGNVIQGNFIGTDASQSLNLSNALNGVRIINAFNNTVGGTAAGAGNVITANAANGVTVTGATATGNSILGNRIFANASLGIDLQWDGVTTNDGGDGDPGANNLQNFPVLTSAVTNGTQLTVAGSINSTAGATLRLEFFASAAGDASAHGEAQRYLGFVDVTADAGGNATFSTVLTASVAVGEVVSATATNTASNDTSEFALNVFAISTPPSIDLDANDSSGSTGSNYNTTWTEDGGTRLLADSDALLQDADSANLVSLTVTITNRLDGTNELLAADTTGTSITASYDSGTGVLSLSGSDSVANYQQVLRTITYDNASQSPNATTRGITFVANDGTSSSNIATASVTIVAANDAPTVANPISDQSATEDAAFNFQFAVNTFADVDAGDVLTYSASGAPSWLSFDAATRTFSGTPVNADVGSYTVTVRATDLAGAFVEDQFDIVVGNTNDAPTVANPIADQAATEDAPFSLQFPVNTFADVDVGDTLTYTVSGVPSWLSFDAATRTFSGTPANADVGTHTITVRATDLSGAFVEDTFDIVVANTNDAPTVANPIADQAATEDAPFSFQFAVNTFDDVDVGDALTYSAAGVPTWLSFDAATRTFSGTPVNADVGSYTITVRATDLSGAFVEDQFDIVVSNTNDAPTVANPIADQAATEDSAFSFQFAVNTFNDVDAGDTLTYTASGVPGWLSFDAATRTFSGTPANADVGIHTVTVRATDLSGAFVEDTFDIVVANTNDAPTVANPIADQAATEDSAFSFQFPVNTFDDVDAGDALTYSAAGVPSWLSFDAATRTFSGTPANADVGSYTITLRATDLSGSFVEDTFDIVVANTNDAPTVANPIADQSVTEDAAFNFQFPLNTFADIDAGDVLTYNASGVPSWLSFDAVTRTFTGTPANADVGTHTITLRATDLSGAFVEDTFDIVVGNTNDAPTVANPIADQTGNEDAAFSFQFPVNTFADVDAGDSLSYTASGVPAWLTFDAATRTFSGTPANADVGSYTITVRATDLSGAFVEDQFDIVVSNTNDAPTVANPIADQAATEDSAFSFQFAVNTFNDVDAGDTLTYTASGVPGWLSFDAATRTFSGTPANADVGTHTVTVRATDLSGAFVEDTFDIVVANTNDAPTVANPIADQAATEDSAFSFQFAVNTFADVDAGDSLSYTASGVPAWLSFDAATRTFSGTPVNGDVGTHTITVRATDLSGAFVEDIFDIVVGNSNDAPTVANPIADQSATEDAAFSFQFPVNTFNDVDAGDALTYSAAGVPSWLSFDAATRTFSGTPANADVGTHSITVRATDLSGAFVEDQFDIVVGNTNDAPTVANPIADQAATEDAAFSFQFPINTFDDVDAGDVLTYTASGVPGWLSFDAATRTFSGTPANADVGTHTITLRATDLSGAFVEDTFDIVVGNTNDAPTVANPIADQAATEDAAFSFQFPVNTFDDVDAGDVLTHSAAGVPSWLSFDAATRTFSGTPANADVGTHTITVRATDASGAFVEDTFDLVVANTNDAPTVANPIADQAATEDAAFSFQFPINTFDDVDVGDALIYSAAGVPSWLSFDAATRTFSGTPANADVGTHTITVRATDLSGAFVEDTFDLVVANTNDAPTVANPIPDQGATEDAAFSFQFPVNTFDDVDAGDALTYSAAGVPSWLSFDATTRTFTGTPANADAGTHTITLRATDASGAFVEDTFDIVVGNTNDAPTVANPIADQAATEDAAFSFQFPVNTFDDVDAGDALTYTASGVPSWLSFDAATRTFTGTPANADVGSHTVTVRATDLSGAFVEDTFDLVVANTNDAPTVANPISDQGATEDAAFSFQFPVNTFDDVDAGDVLTYSAAGVPSWLSFDAATRTFTGTPANADVGSYTITLRATDLAGAFVEDQFDIVVANTNDAPTVANPIADQNATEDAAFSFQFPVNTFDDVDAGDALTYTASGVPAWLSFDAATRTFSGTPANGDVGTHTVTVRATDLSGTFVEDTFDIVVGNTNDAPTVANPIADQAATEDVAFSFQFPVNTFADVDTGDSLSYTASGVPAWLTFDAATRTFTGTPANADAGTHTITVRATDASGAFVEDTFDIVVGNTNDAPTVANPIADQAATEDAPFSLQFPVNTFDDVDVGDTLSYSASGVPAWLSFDAATRSFSGTPANADVGTHTITVRATDASGAFIEDTFDIVVGNINDAPTVANPIADQAATEDAPFSLQFAVSTFADVDAGDSLTYTAAGVPSWLTFDAATRSFSGTPANADVGTYTIAVRATDLSGAFVEDTFDLVVANTNDAPTVANPIADQSATEDAAFSFQFAVDAFADVDVGDSLTYTASGVPGWLSFDAATRTFSGTPANADVGTHTITLRATDASGAFVEERFNLVVGNTNDAPLATDNSYSISEDSPLVVGGRGILQDDADDDGETLRAVLVAGPSHGSLTLNADGSFSYTPNADFFGVDTFTYRAADAASESNVATVLINVAPVNDAPSAATPPGQTLNQGGTLVLANALAITLADVDSAGVLEVSLQAEHGTLRLAGSSGISFVSGANDASAMVIRGTLADLNAALDGLRYTPALNYAGLDRILVTPSDGTDAAPQREVLLQINPSGAISAPAPVLEVPPLPAQPEPALPPSAAPTPEASTSAPVPPASARAEDNATPLAFEVTTPQAREASNLARNTRLPTRLDAVVLKGGDTNSVELLRAALEWEPMQLPEANLSALSFEGRKLSGGWRIEAQDPSKLIEEEKKSVIELLTPASATGLSLSVGAVLWALRTSGLIAALAASTPLWRHLDPLPILGASDEEEEEDKARAAAEEEEAASEDDADARAREEDALARVFDHASSTPRNLGQ